MMKKNALRHMSFLILSIVTTFLVIGCGQKTAEQPQSEKQMEKTLSLPQGATQPTGEEGEETEPSVSEVPTPQEVQPPQEAEEGSATEEPIAVMPAPETAPQEIVSTAQETEWISLFNGVDLTGWRNAWDPSGDITWSAEDGTLTNQEHGENIATVQMWKDFDLRLEYKTVSGGNSGVYLRGRIEIQVLDSYNEPEVGTGSDGAVYGLFAPLVKASKPAGEWNSLEVTLIGNKLTAKLNGQLIHDQREIPSVTGGALPGGVEDAGPLMLQGDHGKVWFRNIEIRPVVTRASE